jgi:hypothetical protein
MDCSVTGPTTASTSVLMGIPKGRIFESVQRRSLSVQHHSECPCAFVTWRLCLCGLFTWRSISSDDDDDDGDDDHDNLTGFIIAYTYWWLPTFLT